MNIQQKNPKTQKTKKPINNSKSKLGKRENHEKQTFASQHLAHGMFTSSSNESDDLCGSMLWCVVWWRFRQEEVEDGRGRK